MVAHHETQAELQAMNAQQPFILSRAPEWLLNRADDMMASPDRIAAGADSEEKCVIASEWLLHYLKEASVENYRRLLGATNETDAAGNYIMVRAKSQDPSTMLRYNTYHQLHNGLMEAMPDEASFQAMQYIMLIHDAGKNPAIVRAVGLDPAKGANHDEVLRRLFSDQYAEQRKRLLPTYEADNIFSEKTKRLIRETMLIEVNWGGLAQSQSGAGEVAKIPAGTDPQVLKMSFWHWVLDAGGVLGYKNPQAALMLTEPTAQVMMCVKRAYLDTPEELGLEPGTILTDDEREEIYLGLRGQLVGADLFALRSQAYDTAAALDAMRNRQAALEKTATSTDPDEYSRQVLAVVEEFPHPYTTYMHAKTMVILSNMMRYSNPADFAPVESGFDALPFRSKEALAWLLAYPSGDTNRTFDWDYGPGLLRNLRDAELQSDMQKAFHFLTSVMEAAERSSHEVKATTPSENSYVVALRDVAIAAGRPDVDFQKIIAGLQVRNYSNTLHVTFDDTTEQA